MNLVSKMMNLVLKMMNASCHSERGAVQQRRDAGGGEFRIENDVFCTLNYVFLYVLTKCVVFLILNDAVVTLVGAAGIPVRVF